MLLNCRSNSYTVAMPPTANSRLPFHHCWYGQSRATLWAGLRSSEQATETVVACASSGRVSRGGRSSQLESRSSQSPFATGSTCNTDRTFAAKADSRSPKSCHHNLRCSSFDACGPAQSPRGDCQYDVRFCVERCERNNGLAGENGVAVFLSPARQSMSSGFISGKNPMCATSSAF